MGLFRRNRVPEPSPNAVGALAAEGAPTMGRSRAGLKSLLGTSSLSKRPSKLLLYSETESVRKLETPRSKQLSNLQKVAAEARELGAPERGPRRKVSISELTHIRSNSNSNINSGPQEDKKFLFFGKLMKQRPSMMRSTSSLSLATARYQENKSLEVLPMASQTNEILDNEAGEVVTPVLGLVSKLQHNPRNPEQVAALGQTADLRLSTVTEDSFYFNSRLPTTPVYSSIGEAGTRSLLMLHKRSPVEHIIEDVMDLPDTPQEEPSETDTKLLPPIGDEIHVKSVLPVRSVATLSSPGLRINQIVARVRSSPQESASPKLRTASLTRSVKHSASVPSISSLENNDFGIIRSPSKRLAKRLSGRLSALPLALIYKFGLPKKVLPEKKTFDAIIVPELRDEAGSNVSHGSSLLENAEIVEALQLVTAKKGDSPVKVDVTNSAKNSRESSPKKEVFPEPNAISVNTALQSGDGPSLSPIEEVDSPESAKPGFPLVAHLLNKVLADSGKSDSEDKISKKSITSASEKDVAIDQTLDVKPETEADNGFDLTLPSESSFVTTETLLPSPLAALFQNNIHSASDEEPESSKASEENITNEKTARDPLLIGVNAGPSSQIIVSKPEESGLEENSAPKGLPRANVIPRHARSPRAARSPRTAITLLGDDFFSRSSKALLIASVGTKRNTLRPILAAFRTPLLLDYEEDADQTPIFEAKNASQITLNFDDRVKSDPSEMAPVDSGTPEPEVRAETPQRIPQILREVMESDAPPLRDMNYERFVRSGESSPSSDFEFATQTDYQKNKKLDFGLSSTPVELSRDPIFANLAKKVELPPAPQPRFPPPVPEKYQNNSESDSTGENPFLDPGRRGSSGLSLVSLLSDARRGSTGVILISLLNLGLDSRPVRRGSTRSIMKESRDMHSISEHGLPEKSLPPLPDSQSKLEAEDAETLASGSRGLNLRTPTTLPFKTKRRPLVQEGSAQLLIRSPISARSARSARSNGTTDLIYQEVSDALSMRKSASLSLLDLKGRHRLRHLSHTLHLLPSVQMLFDETADEYALLFVRATHAFDASTLAADDAAICLSFEKDDIAFVHNFDESGWGEVVLLGDMAQGWVPMNFFRLAIEEPEDSLPIAIAESRIYLRPLFIAAAQFLLAPQLVPVGASGTEMTFSAQHMDSIRDGVKILLQDTNCISRTAPIVHKRPVIRKVRKALLLDWYILMTKADKYKGTTDEAKIENLKTITYRVLVKALAFLDLWGHESASLEAEKKKRRKSRRSKTEKVVYLARVPFARERLFEVRTRLIQYLAVLLGRLDVVEGCDAGCDQLETVIHQVILLLRELLFIGKSASVLLSLLSGSLDSALDSLLAHVSDLVTSVKHVVSRVDADEDLGSIIISDEPFQYLKDGTRLLRIAGQMLVAVSSATESCEDLLKLTKDFQLNIYRKYPDFETMCIPPNDFVRRAVSDIVGNEVAAHRIMRFVVDAGETMRAGCSNRYLAIRAAGPASLTPDGVRTLYDFISTPHSDSRLCAPCTAAEYDAVSSDVVLRSVVYDDAKRVIGASFRALVFLATAELAPQFLVSAFLMTFRSYSLPSELAHELIARFDVGDRERAFLLRTRALRVGDLSTYDSRMTNRRRAVFSTMRVWLESFWRYETDFEVIPMLVNFLNEGASHYLPDELFSLINLCAQLVLQHPSKKHAPNIQQDLQLVSRKIGLRADAAIPSLASEGDVLLLSLTLLAASLALLGAPLALSAYHLPIVGKSGTLEKLIAALRASLGPRWPASDLKTMSLDTMLDAWFALCVQKSSKILPVAAADVSIVAPLELAKQLTAMELRIFRAIGPTELLDENFREKRIHLRRSVNVERSVTFTNLLVELVAELVLSPGMSMKNRIATTKHWLKVASGCLQLRNYNLLAAIVTLLQLLAISRLEKLWSGLSAKYMDAFASLARIVDPSKNFKVYRGLVRPLLQSEGTKSPEPIVPYVNLFLQDIIFANDGNRSKRVAVIDGEEKELINFDKYSRIVHTIAELEYFQVPYPESDATVNASKSSVFSFSPGNTSEPLQIVPDPALEEFILLKLWAANGEALEDRFWEYSLEIQPRVE